MISVLDTNHKSNHKTVTPLFPRKTVLKRQSAEDNKNERGKKNHELRFFSINITRRDR